jgi:hypothetical protein
LSIYKEHLKKTHKLNDLIWDRFSPEIFTFPDELFTLFMPRRRFLAHSRLLFPYTNIA